ATLACVNNADEQNPDAVATGVKYSVAVCKGDVIVCTYTNTRKQGSIELKKDWPGTKGDVTLNIGTSAGGHQTDQQILSGTNGTTGANTVDTGTFFVSETVTNASDFDSTLACEIGRADV